LKKLGFPGGCGIASAPSVFQKLWRRAFDVNRTQLGIIAIFTDSDNALALWVYFILLNEHI